MPALDGVRGVGVLGILLFHAGALRGGWLGVDLFFVLSGFLITSLLLQEHRATGRIRLGAFWGRRARRLLPALFGLLLGIAGLAVAFADTADLDRIRSDALATLAYVANWRSILAGREYWDLFRAPSPLDHTWSLAIEEQFYLLWPPAAYWTLRVGGGRRGLLLALALGLLLASAAWMAWLFDPSQGTARLYYGTDTRIGAVLAGAALAVLLERDVIGGPARPARLWPAAGIVGLAVLAWSWTSLAGTEPLVYRGGLAGLSLAAAVVVGAVVRSPSGPVARLFDLPALRLLGIVSYGTYLWHWPLYLVLSPDRMGFDGVALAVLRMGVSIAVGVASYVWLERPVRRAALSERRGGALALAGAAAVVIGLLAATGLPRRAPDEVPLAVKLPLRSEADLLLVGDSVAHALAPVLVEEGARRGLRVEPGGVPGCMLMRSDRIRFLSGIVLETDGCAAALAGWLERVAHLRPRVVLVVAGWPGAGERRVDGVWRHPCDPVYDERYAADLTASARDYQAHGAMVALVASPPPSVADLSPRYASLWGDVPGADLAVLFRTRIECQNRVRRQVAALTGARVLELDAHLCPEGRCVRELDGVPLRPDGVHFRGLGAARLSSWILDELGPLLVRR